ncbi:MAG: L-threonylcarbamoyladenylate synthase [Kiritimatiellae bacterium]|nr:L-threonylcarbamoyladenylate synthase [Kiritimatiellia bacterium]
MIDPEAIDECARVLNGGGVAVIPTDTVYGLAAHPDFPAAVERLWSIKGRDKTKPIAFLVSNASMLSGKAQELAVRHWPGALTIVQNGEGYRMPDEPDVLKLIEKCGGRLRVTSANLSGDAPAITAQTGIDADFVLDGGKSKIGIPSTVVKVEGERVDVLRQGAIAI